MKLLLADVIAETRLSHRAYYFAVGQRTPLMIAARQDGVATIVPANAEPRECRFEGGLQGLAVSPDGKRVMLVHDGSLSVQDVATGEVIARVDGSFGAAAYSANGLVACTARVPEEGVVRAEIRDAATMRVLGAVDVEDPFGDSGLSLTAHPFRPEFCLWIAAGQDGQSLAAISWDGVKVTERPVTDLSQVTPPAFSPDGATVLVTSDPDELLRFTWPGGELISSFEWPDEDDCPAEYMAFVDQETAIVLSCDNRLYLVDVSGGAVQAEIAVPAHLPRPTNELYPVLADETKLVSDLGSFHALGGGEFVSVHRQSPAAHDEWRDTLIHWKLDPGR
jgi:WD40 repeat protein